MKIAENIRQLRKEAGLTQEQLAETFGVTVGAVYKWESGQSVPELELILQLADFFDMSVDALLGYELEHSGSSRTVERLKECQREKQYDVALLEAEKALSKYPNHFAVVYESAKLLFMAGLETKERHCMEQAKALYQRSLGLLSQNNDHRVGEQSITKRIAEAMLYLNQVDEAVELLKRTNCDGIYNSAIGYTLAVNGKPEEALNYLSEALQKSILEEQIRIFVGYINAYEAIGEYQKGIDAAEWECQVLTRLKSSDDAGYLDKLIALFEAASVDLYLNLGKPEAAKTHLRQAKRDMDRFAEHPVFTMDAIRFYHGNSQERASDDIGGSAEELKNQILLTAKHRQEIEQMWEELKREDEQRDK